VANLWLQTCWWCTEIDQNTYNSLALKIDEQMKYNKKYSGPKTCVKVFKSVQENQLYQQCLYEPLKHCDSATSDEQTFVIHAHRKRTRCSAIAERPRCRVRYFRLKVEDWNWKTIFYKHYRSIFNHCDIIGPQSCQIRWKKTQNKGYCADQGHSRSSRSVPIEIPYATSY